MPGMIAEPLPAFGAVRITVNVSDFTSLPYQCQVFRTTVPPTAVNWFDSLVKVRIRPTYVIGDEFPQFGQTWDSFVGTQEIWYDTEAPLDTPVYYAIELVSGDATFLYAQPATQFISNTDFESNVTGWQGDNASVLTRTTVSPIFGTGSMRVAVTGTPAFAGARPTTRYAVVTGHMYQVSGWLRPSSSTGQARMAIDWYTAADAYISTSYSQQTTIPANVTTFRTLAAKPPVTAAKADPRVLWDAPPAGGVLLADRVTMVDMGIATSAATSTPVTLASNGSGWIHDPEMPAGLVHLDTQPPTDCVDGVDPTGVIFASYSAETRTAAGARFDIAGQANPAVIVATRKSPAATLTLAALSFADRDRVHALYADGAVLMLRVPPEYGVSDRYMDTGDVTTSPLSPDLRLQYRVIDAPHQVCQSPDSPAAGMLGDRFQDLNRYATWNDLDAAQLTSIDLINGAGSTVGIGA